MAESRAGKSAHVNPNTMGPQSRVVGVKTGVIRWPVIMPSSKGENVQH